jgi:hypothetical protein
MNRYILSLIAVLLFAASADAMGRKVWTSQG